jgi:dTDP-4-dehydrorhamnose reductase
VKVIITGANGMLGQDLFLACKQRGWAVQSFSSNEVDITNPEQIDEKMAMHSESDFLINCAAFTRVDDAELKGQRAYEVNAVGPFYLAKWCLKYQMPLVHFSTDYVFDGKKDHPYLEDDGVNPINKYGLSKLGGETAIRSLLKQYFILRTQWLYGENGHHFINTVRALAEQKPEISIVNDQWGAPTSTEEVARMTCELLEKRADWGLYHMTASGETTWYDYARFIVATDNVFCSVKPIPTESYPRPALRPKNGRLNIQKLSEAGIFPMPWSDSVKAYLLKNQKKVKKQTPKTNSINHLLFPKNRAT